MVSLALRKAAGLWGLRASTRAAVQHVSGTAQDTCLQGRESE